MSRGHLSVVEQPAAPGAEVISLAERVRSLQAQARLLAREHVEALTGALAEVSRLAAQIAIGGEAYPIGARELCGRLSEASAAQAETLRAIAERDAH